MEVDPTLVRHAYLYATGVEGLAAKQIRLADITGRGKKADERWRRHWRQVAEDLDADPSGAAARIRAAQDKESSWFVTGRTGKLAADPKHRRDAEQGKPVRRDATRKRWSVEWVKKGQLWGRSLGNCWLIRSWPRPSTRSCARPGVALDFHIIP